MFTESFCSVEISEGTKDSLEYNTISSSYFFHFTSQYFNINVQSLLKFVFK